MKVILENFGPIKRVEYDLAKDLNVIFGKNNIGKSYSITALYIIVKHLLVEFGGNNEPHIQYLNRGGNTGFPHGFATPMFSEEEPQASPLESFTKNVRQALREVGQQIDISVQTAELLKGLFANALEDGLTNSFKNSFESLAKLVNNKQQIAPVIKIESTLFELTFEVQTDRVILEQLKFTKSLFASSYETDMVDASSNLPVLYLKTDLIRREEQLSQLSSVLFTLGMMVGTIGSQLHTIAKGIYFLPASRSGLYQALNTFSALLAELSKSRSFINKGFSLPSFSEPVADYFLQLSTINPSVVSGETANIARQIENEILGGEVRFDEQNKKLYFRQHSTDYSMDLAFASSMISEIAPIVAYCKYVLRWDRQQVASIGHTAIEKFSLSPSLLFIEEPEAHLHPEVQVKLMEFFAHLTKYNVKVVMTSHSNYMFNKLSNLLLTNELEPERVGSYLMRATSEGSVMDAFAMRAEEEGIADENFADVAEQLYNERLEAYDKLNAKQ